MTTEDRQRAEAVQEMSINSHVRGIAAVDALRAKVRSTGRDDIADVVSMLCTLTRERIQAIIDGDTGDPGELRELARLAEF